MERKHPPKRTAFQGLQETLRFVAILLDLKIYVEHGRILIVGIDCVEGCPLEKDREMHQIEACERMWRDRNEVRLAESWVQEGELHFQLSVVIARHLLVLPSLSLPRFGFLPFSSLQPLGLQHC